MPLRLVPTDSVFCPVCFLRIEKIEKRYRFNFIRPMLELPRILKNRQTLLKAFNTRVCPLCTRSMQVEYLAENKRQGS
jgi:hypothetical protein